MNKLVSSIVPQNTKSTKSANKPEPTNGPRVFTATEIAFIALATMIAAGEVTQKEVTGPKSKTYLAITSWRVTSMCDYVTGKDATKRGPAKPSRPLAESRYYLALAEDYLAAYGDVLATTKGKLFIGKARLALETLAKKAA